MNQKSLTLVDLIFSKPIQNENEKPIYSHPRDNVQYGSKRREEAKNETKNEVRKESKNEAKKEPQ